MKLQRILAKDSRSANEQAIAKYGRDVLVVSNNRVNGMTELIVAVDVEPEQMPPPVMPRGAGEPFEAALRQQLQAPTADGQAPGNAAAQGQAGSPGVAEAFIPAQMALMQAAQRAAAQSLGQTEPLRPTPLPATAPQPKAVRYAQQFRLSGPGTSAPAALPLASLTVSRVLEGSVAVAAQERSPTEADTADTAAPSAAAPQGPDGALSMAAISSDKAHALTDLIRAEIDQLRKEMRMGQQLQAWASQGPAHRWNEALSEAGVPTTLRALLMSGLSNDFDDQQALAAIEAQMAENLPKPKAQRGRRAAGAAWTSGVHLLSGPGGSGKTSMAARLAHEAAQRLGVDQVVLVSWNDNRPGAWGQLQMWASRIGVNAFRAADSTVLDLLLQEHQGSLVIVDSGLSQPDILTAAVQGLKASHHLVMPADANAATLRRWVGEHAPCWSDVLITRLDESAQPWPLLQACCEHQLCPAMASDGGGLTQLRQPFDARVLLQHGMAVLAQLLGAGGHSGHAVGQGTPVALDIPTIDRITTTVPPRQAGRSGRSAARGRQGASHA
jgi:flagellar biosynthesis protein FlhF